jgi:hypothetical protein
MAINSEKELLSKFVQLYQAYQQGEFPKEGLAERMEVLLNAYTPEEKTKTPPQVKTLQAESLEGLEIMVNGHLEYLTATGQTLLGSVQYSTQSNGFFSRVTYSAMMTYKRED